MASDEETLRSQLAAAEAEVVRIRGILGSGGSGSHSEDLDGVISPAVAQRRRGPEPGGAAGAEGESPRPRGSAREPRDPSGPRTPGSASGAADVAYLRLQVEAMRALLPILSIPTYTYSLVPGTDPPKEVATYEVMVNYCDSAYAVYRRYSEFRALHDRIEKEFSKDELLPRFPGRKGLWGKTNEDKDAIERRRKELELYIRQLVQSDRVRKSAAVTDFFAQLRLDAAGGEHYAGGDSIPGCPSEHGEAP